MLGRTHALSGATTWMAGCAAATLVGYPPALSTALVGAGLSAGFALLPDVDHPGSTIARTLGPVTRLLSRAVAGLARAVRVSSCRHCETRPSENGHRALTHTALFAVVLGGLVALLAAAGGLWAGLTVIALGFGLAARILLASPTPASSPTPSPTPSDGPRRFGTKVVAPDGASDAAVLEYRQPVAGGAPKPAAAGHQWGAARIQVCAKTETIEVSDLPWALVYADGSSYERSHIGYQQFPAPRYTDRTLTAGRCATGWITFPVPTGKRPQLVQYQPEGGLPVEWRVP